VVVSIRNAMTTLWAVGYNPDTLLLTPANAETLDLAVTGISGGTQDFVFTPAQFAPGTIFGMQRRISKTIPAAAVVDSQAFGKLSTPARSRSPRSRRTPARRTRASFASRATRCSRRAAERRSQGRRVEMAANKTETKREADLRKRPASRGWALLKEDDR
jgi:hypothetical protein